MPRLKAVLKQKIAIDVISKCDQIIYRDIKANAKDY
jgi:hypothetical protein